MQISKTMYFFIILQFMMASAAWAGGVKFNDGMDMTYAVESGWLSKNYDASMEKALQASREVIRFNQMRIVKRERSEQIIYLKAEVVETHDDTCWIKLEPNGRDSTTISIRKAYLSDDSLIKKILWQIDRKI